jgi:hypothetical protein
VLLQAAVILMVRDRPGHSPPLSLLLFPAAIVVFVYFIMRKLLLDLVDEVWDAGDALIVRNKKQEDRIALADVINVNYERFINPQRVTLLLHRPSLFGDEIAFAAPIRLVPFAMSPQVEGLIRRVDAARRGGR